MTATTLRDYQRRALEETRRKYAKGARAICIVMPTGSGKTRLGAEFSLGHLGRSEQHRVLWLAHRIELVDQAAERLRLEGVPDVGVISASARNPSPSAPVQVASLPTLIARGELPPATLVVLDECHHAPADTYSALMAQYAHATRLGLTATPERGDGRPLGDLFDGLVVGTTVRELTELGHLVHAEVYAPAKYTPRALCGDPLERYLEHAAGLRTFAFGRTVEYCEDQARAFRAAGISSRCIHGDTPADERKHTLAAFRAGDITVLWNVNIYTEGTDVPEAECCILARGAGCQSIYLQMVGRVLRPAPGKTRAVVLDLVGMSNRHGLPSDDRDYSLTGRHGIRLAKRLPPAKEKSTPEPYRPGQYDGALRRWCGTGNDYAERRAFLDELFRRAKQGNGERPYKRGWVAHRFRERYGHMPWERPLSGVA